MAYIPIYLDQNTVLGRWEAGFGLAAEVDVQSSLEMAIPGVLRRAALIGDVTAAAGSNMTTVVNDAITFAKMQNVASDTVLGRVSLGDGDLEALVCTAAGRALLDDVDAAAQRATLGVQVGVNVQPFDATLTALAGFNTNGILTQTAPDTFVGRTLMGTTNLITIVNGDGVSGDPTISIGANVYQVGGADVAIADGGTGASDAITARSNLGLTIGVNVQGFDATLAALASFNTNGVLTQTAPDTFVGRTITGTANLITVTNGDGVSGNPTISVGTNVYRVGGTDVALADGGTGASDAATARTNLGIAIGVNVQAFDQTLSSLAAFNTNGLLTQTAADTFTGRTITGTANLITVSNGDGVAGNPTISVGANVYQVGGTDVAIADGGTGASTAAGARANIGVPTIYQNQTVKLTAKVWTGVATTSGGVATFFPTDNNLGTGNAIFTNIYAAISTGANNTATPILVPKTAIKLISADKKTVTVNAIAGVTINILITPTEVFAPDGTTIYLTLIGD